MDVFPYYRQLDAMDCGPTCLRMIAKFYGKSYSLQTLRARSFISRNGVSMLGISDAAESIGFRTSGVRVSFEQLAEDVPLPCILHWNQSHFVVCYDVKKKKGQYSFRIADPATQLVTYNELELKRCWLATKSDGEEKGTALALEPTPDFYNGEGEPELKERGLRFFFRYLTPYRKELFQLILGMLVVSLLQLILPFLTQALVDVGISDGNLSFITLVLVAQIIISVSQLSVEFIRSWILLHVNTRISISLISDFLAKLMKLPLHFFDTKMVGDIIQRIGDHDRIKNFLTGSSISTLFSFVSFFIFAIVLAYYNLVVLGIFLLGNSLYIAWILAFMKYRRELDIRRFAQAAGEQSNLVQMVTAMQEIKLNNCETQKRWQWERIQVKLFENINPHLWRAKTGAVMQDGFIFSETIAQNIVVGEEQVDVERLRHAVTVANIRDFIDSLPLGYNTKIGMEGNGISQGQKQRLLIARAVYKNPEFLFFDEATNALDANNEKEIMEHLHEFYKGKTVVVVAHRLSTVKDADKIVVLDKGCIVEEGTHRELTERKGLYYRLVKNQLELGS